MTSRSKKSFEAVRPTEPLWQRLYYIFLLIFLLDGMVSTPLVLYYVEGSYESNPLHSAYYEMFGLPYFFVSVPVFALIIYFFLAGLDNKIYLWTKKRWPAIVIVIALSLSELFATVNNFIIFFRY